MHALRKYPAFYGVLIALAAVVAGEVWCVIERAGAAKKAEARLEQKRRELRSLATVEPPPTPAIATEIEADLARTHRALAAMQAALRGRGPAAEALQKSAPPARPTDMYFDIATFVERMRERAQRAGVALKPDERFGFAEFANAGPEAELIPAVFRERQVAQHVLEALFDAHPRQLLSVQRERPLKKAEREAVANGAPRPAGGPGAPDFFDIDPRVTARVPGFVDATAFRLAFVGQTASLRALLNKLADFELPLVVRAVEVEPAGAPAHERPPEDGAAAIAPLVPRSLSRFTVTVEFIDLVPAPTPAS